MRWLLFLSRLAFICNVFFLLAVSLQFMQWLKNEEAEATVIVLGYLMAAMLNPLTNLSYGVLLLAKQGKLQQVPRWLVIANVTFLLIQFIYIIFLHGQPPA